MLDTIELNILRSEGGEWAPGPRYRFAIAHITRWWEDGPHCRVCTVDNATHGVWQSYDEVTALLTGAAHSAEYIIDPRD